MTRYSPKRNAAWYSTCLWCQSTFSWVEIMSGSWDRVLFVVEISCGRLSQSETWTNTLQTCHMHTSTLDTLLQHIKTCLWWVWCMFDEFICREDSSDLQLSSAHSTRRRTHTTRKWRGTYVSLTHLTTPCVLRVVCVLLRAQCSENMFCLSSERTKRHVSPPDLTICSIWHRIRAQRSKTCLVSNFGNEMNSFQILLGVDTIFVHDCTYSLGQK